MRTPSTYLYHCVLYGLSLETTTVYYIIILQALLNTSCSGVPVRARIAPICARSQWPSSAYWIVRTDRRKFAKRVNTMQSTRVVLIIIAAAAYVIEIPKNLFFASGRGGRGSRIPVSPSSAARWSLSGTDFTPTKTRADVTLNERAGRANNNYTHRIRVYTRRTHCSTRSSKQDC